MKITEITEPQSYASKEGQLSAMGSNPSSKTPNPKLKAKKKVEELIGDLSESPELSSVKSMSNGGSAHSK